MLLWLERARSRKLLVLCRLPLELAWLLGSKPLWLLLKLLKVLLVELSSCRLLRIETCSIKPLCTSWLVCKGLSLGIKLSLLSNLLLSCNHALLVSQHSVVTLLLKCKGRVDNVCNSGCYRVIHWSCQVCAEPSDVVGGIFNNLNPSIVINKSIFTFF